MSQVVVFCSAQSDDAQEEDGGHTNIADIFIKLDADYDYIGMFFDNITIPQGATIDDATLSLEVESTAHDDIIVDFHCEDIDDSSTFESGTTKISTRTRTTANTSVNDTSVGGGNYDIDITSAVQEVIDRGGWSSGNGLSAIGVRQTSCDAWFASFDHSTKRLRKLRLIIPWRRNLCLQIEDIGKCLEFSFI